MIKNILKFSVSNIVNLFLGLLSVFILTRAFAPETYGILNLFNTTAATALSILYMGLDSSFIRFYNEPPNNDPSSRLGTKLMTLNMLTTVGIGTVTTVFFSDLLTQKIFGFESRLICGLIFVSVAAQIILRYLNIKYRMEFNTKAYTIQSIMIQATLKLFVIVAALFSLDINKVLIINVAGIAAMAAVCLFIQRKEFFSFGGLCNFKGYGGVFYFAVFSLPITVCINLNTFLSQQIISKKLGVAMVGIYSSAAVFVSALGALQGGFGNFWSAYMYANYKEKQDKIKEVNEYLLLAIIIVFAGLVIFKDVIYLLIGEKYQASKGFFSLVLCYPLLSLAAETTAYGTSIENKNHITFFVFLVSVFSNLIMSLLLTPLFGLKGAAAASMISGVVLYILRTVTGQMFYRSISDLRMTVIDVTAIVAISLIPALTDSSLISAGGTAAVTVTVLILNRKRVAYAVGTLRHTLGNIRKKGA